MKKIALNGPAADNAGNFCDGGDELEVSNSAKSGHIDEARAKDLVARGGAHVIAAVSAKAAKKPTAKKRAPRKPSARRPAATKAAATTEVKAPVAEVAPPVSPAPNPE